MTLTTPTSQHSGGETAPQLRVVNSDSRYSRATLIPPSTLGYIHIAAEVRPPSRLGPVISRGREKSRLLERLKELSSELERLDSVEKVTVFDAVAFPPSERLPYVRERVGSIHVARFDVVALIETKSPAATGEVQGTPAYRALLDILRSEPGHTHVVAARNAKRVGEVDRTRKGLFLFNYFVADDADVMLELWEYLAGWYQAETGLDNSTLLVPLEGQTSDYLAINHARWDGGRLRFLSRQLPKKSFRTYVLANLEANRVGAMPILYRLA